MGIGDRHKLNVYTELFHFIQKLKHGTGTEIPDPHQFFGSEPQHIINLSESIKSVSDKRISDSCGHVHFSNR